MQHQVNQEIDHSDSRGDPNSFLLLRISFKDLENFLMTRKLFSESEVRSPGASQEAFQATIYPDDVDLRSVRFSNRHDNVNALKLHQDMGFKIAKENGTYQLEGIQIETSPEMEMFFLE